MGEAVDNPLDFLRALSEAERAALLAAGRTRRYARGQAVFHEGDDPGGVIAITRGRAKVSATGAGGRDVVLRFAGEGELLGELSAMAGRPRTATITALDDLEAVALRRADFRRFVEQHPRVAPLVFERLALLLAEADRQLVDFATRDVTARIAGPPAGTRRNERRAGRRRRPDHPPALPGRARRLGRRLPGGGGPVPAPAPGAGLDRDAAARDPGAQR